MQAGQTGQAGQPRTKSTLVRLVEWIGTHPFVTGLLAILGIVGFVFSLYAFGVDQANNAQSSTQSDRVEDAVGTLAVDSADRDRAMQDSLARIESNAPKSAQDRVPVIAELPYPEARAKLVAAGWVPGTTRWQDLEESGTGARTWALWNFGFNEVEDCAGSSMAQCRFNFSDVAGNRLVVVTRGEEDGEINYDTRTYLGAPSFEHMRVAYLELAE